MKRTAFTFALLLGFTTLLASVIRPAQAAGRKPSDVYLLAPQAAQVTRVIDGDTIQVDIDGAPYTVRYIGVDAPALNECYGAAARSYNASLVEGQVVRLEADVKDYDASDQYLMRYVYLLNATMVNEALVNGGYARAVASDPNLKHQGDLNTLEEGARAARRGGWSGCRWTSAVAKEPGACPAIAAEVLAQPGPRPGAVNMLRDGECFTLVKAANPAGPEWSGQYIYHPAGTVIRLDTSLYARWKDAAVMIEVDVNGTPLAHVVKDTWYPYRPWLPPSPDPVPGSRRVSPQVLERDKGRPEMLQIPNPRTWLFRDLGNGTYQTMVDVFVYRSGEMRALYYANNGYLH